MERFRARVLAMATALAFCGAGCNTAPAAAEQGLLRDDAVRWRGLSLWRSEHALVLAHDERGAIEAERFVRETRALCSEVAGVWPARGLVIATGPGEPLLSADEDEPLTAALRQHVEVVGGDARSSQHRRRTGGGAGGPDVDERVLLQMTAVALPPQDPELALPAILAADVPHAVLLPTRSALLAAARRLVEAGMEQQDVGFFERTLVRAAFDPAELVDEQLSLALRAQLLAIWRATGALPDDAFARVCEHLGIEQGGDARGDAAPWQPVDAETAHARLLTAGDFAEHRDLGIAVMGLVDESTAVAIGSLGYALVVDIHPVPLRRPEWFGPHVAHRRVHVDGLLPSREAAEQLERWLQRHPGKAVVVDVDAERAAALWARHAFDVRGWTADDALGLALDLGMHPALEPALRETLVR